MSKTHRGSVAAQGKHKRSSKVSKANVAQDPAQAKLRILFHLMLALIESEYGKSPQNIKVNEGLRRRWHALEQQELRSSKKPTK